MNLINMTFKKKKKEENLSYTVTLYILHMN